LGLAIIIFIELPFSLPYKIIVILLYALYKYRLLDKLFDMFETRLPSFLSYFHYSILPQYFYTASYLFDINIMDTILYSRQLLDISVSSLHIFYATL